MLNTETNTPAMEARVLEAFELSPYCGGGPFAHTPCADFEHGQWWITCIGCGAQWSVCDAEGGPAVDGFDFEQVTEGEEV